MRRAFEDWPEPGPIDLAIHDLPHRSSTTEWWYVNTHLELEGSRSVSLFAAFFRQLFEAMFAGATMPAAWVKFAPQGPSSVGHDACPGTIFVCELGQIAFRRP